MMHVVNMFDPFIRMTHSLPRRDGWLGTDQSRPPLLGGNTQAEHGPSHVCATIQQKSLGPPFLYYSLPGEAPFPSASTAPDAEASEKT